MKTPLLRLLTINTWKCDGNYRSRMALLNAQLSELQPDVIACQEVFRAETDPPTDTGLALANTLGMHYASAPARHKARLFEGHWVGSDSGLGLLSRFPILNTENVVLPTHPNDGERLAQVSWLDVEGEPVLVINTHLTHLRGQSELRKQQLAAILAHPSLAESRAATFLCGDFNAEIQSEELKFLLNVPAVSVQNAYQSGNGTPPGYTMIVGNGNQLESAGHSRCIDFIFSLTNGNHPHPAITEAHVVLDVADADGNYPSDHLGVMITAQLP